MLAAIAPETWGSEYSKSHFHGLDWALTLGGIRTLSKSIIELRIKFANRLTDFFLPWYTMWTELKRTVMVQFRFAMALSRTFKSTQTLIRKSKQSV